MLIFDRYSSPLFDGVAEDIYECWLTVAFGCMADCERVGYEGSVWLLFSRWYPTEIGLGGRAQLYFLRITWADLCQ